MERKDIKRIRELTGLACIVYFCSYLSRINFSAILVEFLAAENLSKTSASVITSALFVTYGLGQILSGYLGDRISPRGLIFTGLATAAVCNGLMPVCSPRLPAMALIWGVNGAAQALIWPPLARILTNNLSGEEYGRRVPLISTSSSLATIVVYLLAPWAIRTWNWEAVLYAGAIAAGAGALIWLLGSEKFASPVRKAGTITPEAGEVHTDEKHRIRLWIMPGILMGIACQGVLRDGITTWMPTLVSEVFSLEGSVTILTGVALPVFQTGATLCVHWILKKMRGAVFSCAALLFGAVGLTLGLLAAGGMDGPETCVAGIAVATGFVQGINVLQTCYIPVYFRSSGRVSLISGLVNAATYGGSALSIGLFGAISERQGWSAVVGLWILLAVAGAFLSGICAALSEKRNMTNNGGDKPMKIEMLPKECWWGGIVDLGWKMPWDETSCVTLDPTSMGRDQRAPVYLSSCGRCLWSDSPFTLTFRNGIMETDREVRLAQEGNNLKGAHAAMWKALDSQNAIPDRRFFTVPQYNTWMELTYGQEQTHILEYAHAIVDNGMEPGILMIDEGWSEDYGVYDFYPGRFSDPVGMVRELHELGFLVMLWVTPYISPDSNAFRSLRNTDLLLRNREGQFALREWWNGFSCVLDLSNPAAGDWLREKLVRLQNVYGIDGFKFDGGDPAMYRWDDRRASPRLSLECTEDYGKFASFWPFNELRAVWNQGGQPLVCRLQDKLHVWDARGLKAVIPGMIAQGLLGYYYGCPDMIGGGDYASLSDDAGLDEELYIRWLEASLLCPMIQFSLAPWRILSPTNFETVRKLIALRRRYTPHILAAVENAARNHEPVLRSLEYEYPGEGYEREQSMYLLGSTCLLVPMLEKSGIERTVRLPRGEWRESDGTLYSGGSEVTLTYPLDKVYIFEKQINA